MFFFFFYQVPKICFIFKVLFPLSRSDLKVKELKGRKKSDIKKKKKKILDSIKNTLLLVESLLVGLSRGVDVCPLQSKELKKAGYRKRKTSLSWPYL